MSELDNPAATDNVAPFSGSQPEPAVTTTESASVPTEAPNGEAPAEPAAAAQPPDWFVKETAKLRRQRVAQEQRADRLAAEVEALKKGAPQTAQPKSTELRSESFPNYDAYQDTKTRLTVREELEASERTRAQNEAQKTAQSQTASFMEKLTEKAEAAGIDLDAVLDTLAQPHVPFTNMVMGLIGERDNVAQLAEYLAENPSELDRVSRLGPALAKKALDKVEAGLAAPPKSSATNAPPPPPKVGGRSVNQTDWRKSENMDDYGANWNREREAKLKD